MDSTKPVQGVAVYAEFARSGGTTQVIVTPRGFDESDKECAAALIRRTISTGNPRKQWRFAFLDAPTNDQIERRKTEVHPTDSLAEVRTDLMMRYAQSLFDQILRGGWTLVGSAPVLVEVSKSDLTAIRQRKTPTKLLYRCTQTRAAMGYPAEVVNTY